MNFIERVEHNFKEGSIPMRGPTVRGTLDGSIDLLCFPTEWTHHLRPFVPQEIRWVREHYSRRKKDNKKLKYEADYPGQQNVTSFCPAVHMKKEWSRISIQIGEMRGCLLFNVTREEMKRMGYRDSDDFKRRWNREHRYDGLNWKTNPTVWLITFQRIKPKTDKPQTAKTYHY
jgi:hypothetical protein